ncbi:hypothetical protein A7U60_g5970 [Sanghuangporus baumii]|uniref:Uncharacterized protein n=1 Tax=Sanghuangporus baumii TaxID=108892 RepID=A0A9Q5HVZ3_SANBA|nr:hypothetical protein A7U60_g5970 [Sanghuangporus baumii]
MKLIRARNQSPCGAFHLVTNEWTEKTKMPSLTGVGLKNLLEAAFDKLDVHQLAKLRSGNARILEVSLVYPEKKLLPGLDARKEL